MNLDVRPVAPGSRVAVPEASPTAIAPAAHRVLRNTDAVLALSGLGTSNE